MSDDRRTVVVHALMRVIDEHWNKDPSFGAMADAVLAALDAMDPLHDTIAHVRAGGFGVKAAGCPACESPPEGV